MSSRTPTQAELIRQAIENRLAELHVMLPGRIESYDADTQKADVKPMIRRLQEGAEEEVNESIPVIPSVPVRFPRAGGFKITFPVKKGDRCKLVFCERSIDNYQGSASGEEVDPESFQTHDLSDPVAELGWYPDADALSATDGDDMVLGKEGGAVIHIADDQINLYEKAAAQFVALAQKVLDELGVAKADRDAMKTVFDTHFHTTTATTSVGPIGIIAPTLTPFGSQTSPSSVAADKVKAT